MVAILVAFAVIGPLAAVRRVGRRGAHQPVALTVGAVGPGRADPGRGPLIAVLVALAVIGPFAGVAGIVAAQRIAAAVGGVGARGAQAAFAARVAGLVAFAVKGPFAAVRAARRRAAQGQAPAIGGVGAGGAQAGIVVDVPALVALAVIGPFAAVRARRNRAAQRQALAIERVGAGGTGAAAALVARLVAFAVEGPLAGVGGIADDFRGGRQGRQGLQRQIPGHRLAAGALIVAQGAAGVVAKHAVDAARVVAQHRQRRLHRPPVLAVEAEAALDVGGGGLGRRGRCRVAVGNRLRIVGGRGQGGDLDLGELGEAALGIGLQVQVERRDLLLGRGDVLHRLPHHQLGRRRVYGWPGGRPRRRHRRRYRIDDPDASRRRRRFRFLRAEEEIPGQRRMVPRHLLAVGLLDYLLPDPGQHLADLQARGVYVLQQGGRERAVRTLAVQRHVVRLGGIGDQGADAAADPRQPAADGGRAGRPHAARQVARQRIVAAGIQQHDVGARLALQLIEDGVQLDCLEIQVRLVLQLGIHRHQVVGAAHLQPVPGVEEQPDIRTAQGAGELPDQILGAVAVEVDALQHLEVEAAQHFRDGAAVIRRVRQDGGVLIGAVADHQGDPAPFGARGCAGGGEQKNESDPCQPLHRGPPTVAIVLFSRP